MTKFIVDGNKATKTIDFEWSRQEYNLAKEVTNSSKIYTDLYDYIDSHTYQHEWLDNAEPLHDFVNIIIQNFGTLDVTSEDIELAYYVLSDALQTCIEHRKIIEEFNKTYPDFWYSDFTTYNLVVTEDHSIKIIDLDAFRNGTNYKNTGCAMDDRLIHTINTIIYWQNTIAFHRKVAQ